MAGTPTSLVTISQKTDISGRRHCKYVRVTYFNLIRGDLRGMLFLAGRLGSVLEQFWLGCSLSVCNEYFRDGTI